MNRPSETAIIKLLKQGKTHLEICKQLGTHSQRVTALSKMLKEDEGHHVKHERITSHYIFTSRGDNDRFINNCF